MTESTKRKALGLQHLAKKLMRDRIDFPESRVGEYSIAKRQFEKPWVVNVRDSLFTGLPAVDYPGPITIHELNGPEGTWMTDMPCELVQMHDELTVHARGNVLIGGLGLGIVARQAALKKSVHKAVVVERQPEVIELVRPYLNGKTIVVRADVNEYVKTVERGQYDTALLDTWQGTGEWAWQTEVVPLRRAIGNKIKHVHCWHEEVMICQVAMMLYRAAALPVETFLQYNTCHYYAFRRGIVDIGIRTATSKFTKAELEDRKIIVPLMEAEHENMNDTELRGQVALFLRTVGEPMWEHFYGRYWDEAWALRPKNEDEVNS